MNSDTDKNEPAFRVGDVVSFTGTYIGPHALGGASIEGADGLKHWLPAEQLELVKRPKPKRTVELDEEAILALWNRVELADIHPTLLGPIRDAVAEIMAAER